MQKIPAMGMPPALYTALGPGRDMAIPPDRLIEGPFQAPLSFYVPPDENSDKLGRQLDEFSQNLPNDMKDLQIGLN